MLLDIAALHYQSTIINHRKMHLFENTFINLSTFSPWFAIDLLKEMRVTGVMSITLKQTCKRCLTMCRRCVHIIYSDYSEKHFHTLRIYL